MRERLSFGILVGLLVFLIAFVFAILGKGEYVPPTSEGSAPGGGPPQVAVVASAALPL